MKNALIYGIGQSLNRAVTYLLLPFFTVYLSTEDFGIIAILGLISLAGTSIFSLGLGASLGVNYFDDAAPAHKETMIWTAFVILSASVFVLLMGGLASVHLLSLLVFQTSGYTYLIALTLLSIATNIPTIPLMQYLQFEQQVKAFVILSLLSTLCTVGASLAGVIVLHRGVAGWVEGQLAGQILLTGILVALVASKLRYRFGWHASREILRNGIPLVPSFIFLFVLTHGNKYLLEYLDGLDTTGIYNVGFNIGWAMSLIVTGFQTAWLPYFMSFADRQGEARIVFGRITTYYVTGFGAINLCFFIFSKPVIMIMTQPAFYDAYRVVGFSAGAQYLLGISSVLLPALYFAKDVRLTALLQALPAALSVGINLVLIPLFGLTGAALALMLGFLIMDAIYYIWNMLHRHRYLNVQYEWRRLMVFALIYVAYAALALWKRDLSLPAEILLSTTLALTLPVVLYALLNISERQMLRNRIMLLRQRIAELRIF